METQKKCSNKNHIEINAINYCPECNLYLCNKCSNYHKDLLENHLIYNLDKIEEEIFIDICNEQNHKIKLEFYCKDHNKLCCAACLSKIKGKGNGQHFNCNVCLIEEIKEEKKNKLNENIKYLEDFSEKIDNLINELKKLFKRIIESKEALKLKISNLFTKIRNTINEREDEILLSLDNIFDKTFFKEDIIKNGEKIPNQIKIYMEKGKKLIKEWDDNNNIKLNNKINDCINIENNIKTIKEIKESIDKCKSKEVNIHFYPEKEEEIIEYLEKIKKFGEIDDKEPEFKFKFKPGNNYSVTNNGLIATKDKGGNSWNCVIFGDKEIPKNKISKWKIKIKTDVSNNCCDFYIGIGPSNFKGSLYDESWSLYSNCTNSYYKIKEKGSKINNHKEKLKKNDIIEVIVDRKLGNLSFAINDINYGIACSNIPKEEILYPTVVIFEQNHIVEIV